MILQVILIVMGLSVFASFYLGRKNGKLAAVFLSIVN